MSNEVKQRIAQRYRDLIREIGRELGLARGWKGRVAERLGLDPTYLSRILGGQRKVGLGVAERSALRLNIGIEFFIGAREEAGSYLDFRTQIRDTPRFDPVAAVIDALAKLSEEDRCVAISCAVDRWGWVRDQVEIDYDPPVDERQIGREQARATTMTKAAVAYGRDCADAGRLAQVLARVQPNASVITSWGDINALDHRNGADVIVSSNVIGVRYDALFALLGGRDQLVLEADLE